VAETSRNVILLATDHPPNLEEPAIIVADDAPRTRG
jgi:hypothetical protein